MRNVGEQVTIKSLLSTGNYGEFFVVSEMIKYAGMKARITSVIKSSERSGGGCYRLCIGKKTWGWTDKMFEESS